MGERLGILRLSPHGAGENVSKHFLNWLPQAAACFWLYASHYRQNKSIGFLIFFNYYLTLDWSCSCRDTQTDSSAVFIKGEEKLKNLSSVCNDRNQKKPC